MSFEQENSSFLIKKEKLTYTSCYCEENIWKFLEFISISNENLNLDEFYAIFISNKNKTVPIWYQSKCDDPKVPVVWDYHVIAVHRSSATKKSYVYDLDTILSFPEPFETYAKKALLIIPNLNKVYHRAFRVVPAKYYLENFASNRSHMIDAKTGTYQSPPPNYPCIESKDSKNNINEFISMVDTHETSSSQAVARKKHGKVMDQSEFESYFTNFSITKEDIFE